MPVEVSNEKMPVLPSINYKDAGLESRTPPNDPQSPQTQPRSTLKSILLVLTCSLTMVINVATSSTAVSMAIPTAGRDLAIPEDRIHWIISAFALSSGCFLLFFGRIADLYGRKRVFLFGTSWMAISSLGCALAPNEIALYILRGFQGAGPAATIPAALGILARSFPPSRERSLAFATFSAGAPLGGAVGTVIGGLLIQWTSSWRAPFFCIAGLATCPTIAGFFLIDADIPKEVTDRRVDVVGAGLVTVGLCFVTFVLAQAEIAPQGWGTPYIVALGILGILLIVLFLLWEHRMTIKGYPPLLRLQLWTRANGRFAAMQLIAFLNWAAFISFALWAQESLYYQAYLEYTPIQTLIRFLPMPVSGFLCNIFVALVVGRIDGLYIIIVGTLATGIACLLFAVIDTQAVYWTYGFFAAILSVFGADFVFASGTLFVAKVALPEEQSVAGALFQTMNQLGISFGLAITTTVRNRVTRQAAAVQGVAEGPSTLKLVPKAAILAGYRAAQWTSFGFAMAAMLVAIVWLRNIGIVGDKRIQEAEIEKAEIKKAEIEEEEIEEEEISKSETSTIHPLKM